METPVQTAARLLVALGELVELEEIYLREARFDLVVVARTRAEPLVQELVALSGISGVRQLREQVMALVERSTRHASLLQEKIEACSSELQRTAQARLRTNQFAPAYVATPAAAHGSFHAAG